MTNEWSPPEGHPLSVADAKRLLSGELGNHYRNILRSSCAPLFWSLHEEQFPEVLGNGTLTFVQTDGRLLGVTAAHVIRGYEQDREKYNTRLHIFNYIVDQIDIISVSDELDIATISLNESDLAEIEKKIVPLSYWPPRVPQEGRGIMLAGYPGIDRLDSGQLKINWGLFTAFGVARRISNTQITWVVERDFGLYCDSVPNLPLNHPLGGISGGPLIAFFETKSHFSYYVLSGIISQANENLENVVARRADFICSDGSIVNFMR